MHQLVKICNIWQRWPTWLLRPCCEGRMSMQVSVTDALAGRRGGASGDADPERQRRRRRGSGGRGAAGAARARASVRAARPRCRHPRPRRPLRGQRWGVLRRRRRRRAGGRHRRAAPHQPDLRRGPQDVPASRGPRAGRRPRPAGRRAGRRQDPWPRAADPHHQAPLRPCHPPVRARRLPAGRLRAGAPRRRSRAHLRAPARPRARPRPEPTGGWPPETRARSLVCMTRSPRTVRVASRPAAPQEATWPPDPFAYLDGLPLDELVADAGTPAYVYALDAVAAAYRRVAAAFAPIGGRVLYAVKANSNLAVLATLARHGAGFDVVS